MSTPLEIIVTASTSGAKSELQTVQAELGKVALAAQKTDSSLQKFGTSISNSSQALNTVENSAAKSASAMAGFGSSLPIGGIGLLAAALFSGAQKFIEWITAESEAEKTQRLLNTAINQAVASVSAEVIQLQTLVSVARDSNNSREVQQAAIDKINKLYPELNANLTLENVNTKAVTNAINEQIKALQDVAKAKALNRLVDTTSQELEAAKQKFQEDKAGGYFHSSDATADLITIITLTKRLDEYTKALIANTEEQSKQIPHTGRLKAIDDQIKALKQQKELQASTIEDTKNFNAQIKKLEDERNTIDPKDIKTKTTKAAKENPFEDELNALNTFYSKELEATKGARILILNVEIDYYTKRIELAKKYGKSYSELITKEFELTGKQRAFSLPDIIPNIKSQDLIDFSKLATTKINLDPIRKSFQDLFGSITKTENNFKDDFVKTLNSIATSVGVDAFEQLGIDIGNALTGKLDGKDIFGNLFAIIGAGFKQLGKAMIAYGLALEIVKKAAIKNPILAIAAGVALIVLGTVMQKSIIKGFAGGVRNFGGGLAIVGEKGPELAYLPRGSNVIPNNQISSVGGSAIDVFVHGEIQGSNLLVVMDRAIARRGRNG